jgi:hypothetical protein
MAATGPTYYLAYKTDDNCFKHAKLDNGNTDLTSLFDKSKNGNTLEQSDYNVLFSTSTPASASASASASAHSIYILQKTIDNSNPLACTTILIRKIETENSKALEDLIKAGTVIKLEDLKPGFMLQGGSPSPKRKSSSAGSTMKNRIKKNKNNYKNKQKSNTRKN